jgi:uncharacterized protein (TIGR02118 family)
MAKLLIMYNQPADPAAFDAHYFGTHVPIFVQSPGIRGGSFNRGPVVPLVGDNAIYLVAEVEFDSMDELNAALASAPAQAAIADLPNFAGAGVTILAYERHTVAEALASAAA